MISTAMILAAGRGERMRPLTDSLPKPLLEVGGKSLIAFHIDAVREAGFSRVVINHAWLGKKIVEAIERLDTGDLEVFFSDEGDTALETGGGIFKALPVLGDRPFAVINGDIWCDYPLTELPDTLIGDAHLVMVDNPAHNENGDFALNSGKLTESLMGSGNHLLTYSGIGVYRPELFTGCKEGIFPLAPLIRSAIQKGQVTGEYYTGNWFDVGTPQRLEELDTWLRTRNRC